MTTVLGHRGYLGKVVERRWHEMGWTGDYVVVCLTPDNLPLLRRLAARPGVIVPSTDAIAEDGEYAAAKREVEDIAGLVVIRAGIVDTRKRHRDGYLNWYANPLTPLEWADLAWEKRDQPGVHVAGGEVITRWGIGSNVADIFGGPQPVRRVHPGDLDRAQPPDRERSLRTALYDFRDWLG